MGGKAIVLHAAEGKFCPVTAFQSIIRMWRQQNKRAAVGTFHRSHVSYHVCPAIDVRS